MRIRPWGAATLLLLSCVAASPARCQPSESFLLRIDGRVDSTFTCQGEEVETLVFHDGLVVRKAIAETGLITLLRLQAPPAALRRLTEALGKNRVGIAKGDCVVAVPVPNAFFDFTVTWFGRSGRRNTFAVTSRPGELCPASTRAIFDAIEEFLRAASLDPGGERVEMTSDAGPCSG